MGRRVILPWTIIWVVVLFTIHSYARAADGEYKEDALGTIGNPLQQAPDTDPSIAETMDRFEDEVEPGKQNIIKVGIIMLKEEKLFFSPLIQQSMAFEWWTLTGRTAELKEKLRAKVQTYCKLKGAREMTRRMHRKREVATMGFRDVYYTFEIEEVLWIKSRDEIFEIKRRIDDAVARADAYYEKGRFAEALPQYDTAKTLAEKYLPNAVSYLVLDRASECRAKVGEE